MDEYVTCCDKHHSRRVSSLQWWHRYATIRCTRSKFSGLAGEASYSKRGWSRRPIHGTVSLGQEQRKQRREVPESHRHVWVAIYRSTWWVSLRFFSSLLLLSSCIRTGNHFGSPIVSNAGKVALACTMDRLWLFRQLKIYSAGSNCPPRIQFSDIDPHMTWEPIRAY